MKTFLKKLANLLSSLLVFPIVLLYWSSAAVFSSPKVFPGWSQFMSLFPGLCGAYLRRAFYRVVVSHIGEDVWISFGTVFSHTSVSLGDSVYIGTGCMIGDIEIQNNVLIGSHVSVINGNQQHGIDRLDIAVREQGGIYPRVVIGEDSWVGDRAVVMFNVGKHCVVGAGSVVTKPVEEFQIVVGNPAKIIGRRDELNSSKDQGLPKSVSQDL